MKNSNLEKQIEGRKASGIIEPSQTRTSKNRFD